jgi:hypothetical protein
MTAETATPSAIVTRFRNQLALIQTQWITVPATLHRFSEKLGDQVRHALNLPTRDDMARLSERLDEIDARLRDLATAPAPALEKKNGGAKKKA